MPANGPFAAPPPLPTHLHASYPFQRRLFRHGAHWIHFVDHGEGTPVLLQHGNPTWSFLWRKVIRRLEGQGLRIIAPDLLGLGLSSKPRDPSVHTLDRHAELISALIRALDLEDLVVVGQDWGGPIAAMAAARNPERVRGAVFANTAVRQPKKPPRITPFHRLSHTPVVSDLLFQWLNGVVLAMPFAQGDRSSIGWDELKAYWWPLRRLADRVAPLALARMVPLSLDHPTVATLGEADAWARDFDGPVWLVWGMRDPILGPALKGMQQLFDDAIVFKTDAGHFLQEEVPIALAQAIVQVVDADRASQNE